MSKEDQKVSVEAFPPVTKSNVPIGTVIMYAGLLEDGGEDYLDQHGWMICDGRLLDQDKYRELHKVLRSSYGVDGAKFHIPDCRGLFVRGVNGNSKNDLEAKERTAQNNGGNTGNMVGTLQDDEFRSHNHKNLNATKASGERQRLAAGKNTDSVGNIHTTNAGGSETRPKNIAFYYIIKYKTVS